MNNIPQIETVMSNMTKLIMDGITIYYSYETPIAYVYKGHQHIRKNDWSTTTGKHLNWVNEDKSLRVDGTVFELDLKDILDVLYGMGDNNVNL